MPLIEDEPPSTLPRGQKIFLPPAPLSGSVSKHQLIDGSAKVLPKPRGMWIQRLVSWPPASSSTTRTLGSSVSRAASAQPAEPAPTTTKSASSASCAIASSGFLRASLAQPSAESIPPRRRRGDGSGERAVDRCEPANAGQVVG